MRYPRSVFLIISNEFCERFCYYGMRAVLGLYMKTILKYNDDEAVELFHTFIMLCYLFPIFGAMLADSYLGKYRTILYLSILYAVGCVTLSLSSITILGLPQRTTSLLGLILIAVGTGGIKPCVSTLGGDQFKLPQQERQLQKFFSYFYAAINAGALLSLIVTPVLREDVKCFGENSCFPLAFGIPAILMLIALCIFVFGTPLYVKKNPEGNVIVITVKCIWLALKNKFYQRSNKDGKKEHWLDYAEDKYGADQISEIKIACNVLLLLIPAPIYWALYDQQGSRWVFQATRMDGRLLGYTIKPDQMHIFDPLLVVILIPLFEAYLYPCLRKLKLGTALRKLSMGCILVAISFVMSAILEFHLEKTYPTLPSSTESQLWLFNSLDRDVGIQFERGNLERIPTLNGRKFDFQFANNDSSKLVPFDISSDDSRNVSSSSRSYVTLERGRILSYIIFTNDTKEIAVFHPDMSDDLEKNLNGLPKTRIFYGAKYDTKAEITLISSIDRKEEITVYSNRITKFINLPAASRYDVYVNKVQVSQNINFDPGSMSTLLVRDDGHGNVKANIIGMVPSNSIHILWQLPQIIVITISEVMFSVTGLEFCFTQAPESMKSVISAAWLLTTTFGNLLVVVISEIKIFKRQVHEFLLYAVLMLADTAVLMVLARNYRYRTDSSTDVVS